jgi:cell division ATPase FtsA
MPESCNRREFARRAVLSSLAVGAGTASGEETKSAPETAASEESLTSAEDLLLEVIQQRYPSENLTPEILQQIRGDISGHLYRSRVLKSVPLTNGEAPFVFSASITNR